VSWSVEWSKGARKDLDRLDADVAKRVVRAVDQLAETGQGDVKKLKGMGGLLRLRVADWRVFFQVQDEWLLVLEVVHRSDAY